MIAWARDRLFEEAEVEVAEDKEDDFKSWITTAISNDILSSFLVSKGTEAVTEIAKNMGFDSEFVVMAKNCEPLKGLLELLIVKELEESSESDLDDSECEEDEEEDEEDNEEENECSGESGCESSEEEETDANLIAEEAATIGIKNKKLKRIRQMIDDEDDHV